MVVTDEIIRQAEYMIANGSTVRKTATKFCVSKSTIHVNLTVRLEKINSTLFWEVRKVLDKNKAERHIRGGIATARRYKKK